MESTQSTTDTIEKTTSKTHIDVINRTSQAENTNIVLFNRIPKTGSEMFEHFGKLLSSILGYHTYLDPQVMTLFPSDIEKKAFAKKFYKQINDSGIYYRHMTYFNFTKWEKPRPIYVSVVRHPIGKGSFINYVNRIFEPLPPLQANLKGGL